MDKIGKFNGFSYFCPKLLKNLWFSNVFLYYWMWNTTADQIRIELKQLLFLCRRHHQSIRSALFFITLIVPESSIVKFILKICETFVFLMGVATIYIYIYIYISFLDHFPLPVPFSFVFLYNQNHPKSSNFIKKS